MGMSVRCISDELDVPTVTSATGKVWMDRNLGAAQVATSATDEAAYGDLYQWGRPEDGHEKRTARRRQPCGPAVPLSQITVTS